MAVNKLWASNDPTPTPTPSLQPRSGPVVWMGSPDEFDAVKVDSLLEPVRSLSPDSEGEWNRRDLEGKNRRELGKKDSSCGGKSSCDPWQCKDGVLEGKGSDYDEHVAKTADGRICKWWIGVEDEHGRTYAEDKYGFTQTEQK